MWKENKWTNTISTKLTFYTSSVGKYSEYIDRVIDLAECFRGRISIMEIMSLSNSMFHALEVRKFQMTKSDVEKEALKRLEDAVT